MQAIRLNCYAKKAIEIIPKRQLFNKYLIFTGQWFLNIYLILFIIVIKNKLSLKIMHVCSLVLQYNL